MPLDPQPFERTGIYRFGFAFAAAVFVADITNVVGLSPYTVSIKYAYTAAILLLLYHYFSRFAYFSAHTLGPPLALLFFLVTGIVFAINLTRRVEISYVTAFTAPLVFAAAAFLPPWRFTVDASIVCRDLRRLFLLGSVCYLCEASLKASGVARSFSYAAEIEHVKSIVCVFAFCLALLTRNRAYAILVSAIIAASLAVRPSSTLLVSVAVCGPLSWAMAAGRKRTAAAGAWSALSFAAAIPWLFYWFFRPLADAATSIDGYLKHDLLEGHSNTDFRLEIIKLALRKLDGSVLFGEGLSGNPNVDLGAHWPWWHQVVPNGAALIHSDWLVVVSQAGAVGAVLFFAMFASVLRVRLRALNALHPVAPPEAKALLSFSVAAAVAFFLYSSFNPVLPLYHIAHTFWFVLLVSEVAAKGVSQPATRSAPAPAGVALALRT